MQDGVLRCEVSCVNGRTHSESILPLAEEALAHAGFSMEDIDLFAAVAGPGSFTGVRIGVTMIKAMAHARNKPCLGVNALEALAAGAPHFDGLVCAIQDARAGQVYAAAFLHGERVLLDNALPMTEFLQNVCALGQPALFVGDGVQKHEEAIKQAGFIAGGALLRTVRPGAAALLAQKYAPLAGDYLALKPLYLRAPQAERARQAALSHE